MIKSTREARRIGKLGKGRPKTYQDLERARAQRRAAGLASGRARKALALAKALRT